MNLKSIEEEFDEKFLTEHYKTKQILFKLEANEDTIKQFISNSIKELLEELREEDLYVPPFKEDGESASPDEVYRSGYNARNQILNDEIDKILNNK